MAQVESGDSHNLVCVPGQRLCLMDKGYVAGAGTYEHQGYIHSSLVGMFKILDSKSDAGASEKSRKIVEVRGINEQSIVPTAGDIVTAKVSIITQRFCKCLIKCIGDVALSRPFRANLRKEDIRSTDKDHVDIYKCFRPGDIILARVLPLTEVNTYYLTTAENELGVAIAHSSAGVPMIPISWTEMQCPKTHIKEPRKVAKIIPEQISID